MKTKKKYNKQKKEFFYWNQKKIRKKGNLVNPQKPDGEKEIESKNFCFDSNFRVRLASFFIKKNVFCL